MLRMIAAAALLITFFAGTGPGAPVKDGSSQLPPTLPSTLSGIHLGMEFNYQEATVNGRKPLEGLQSAGAPVDYVFGADCVGRGSQANIPDLTGHAFHDYYLSWPRDSACGNRFTTAWYLQNHPDWVLYLADHKTIPFVWGDDTNTPLDFTNPAVQAFVVNSWIKPALAAGFQGVVFDNGPGANYLAATGHFDPAGHWVQLYSGSWVDPAYYTANAAAFAQIAAQVHAFNPNATVSINQGDDCNDDQTMLASGDASADIIMDQAGFTNGANTSLPYVANYPNQFCPQGKWLTMLQWAVHLARDPHPGAQAALRPQDGDGQGKALFFINPEPYTVTPFLTDSDPQARFDLQWVLANYLLVNYGHTYLWWGGTTQQAGTLPIPQHEYAAAQAIGSPRGDYYQLSPGLYARAYSGGLALVNPSKSDTLAASFPPGQYEDLYAHPVSSLQLPPHSGAVLLTAPAPTPTSLPTAAPTDTPAPPTPTALPTSSPTPTATPATCSTVTLAGQHYSLCLAP